jgi:hypothetical protein
VGLVPAPAAIRSAICLGSLEGLFPLELVRIIGPDCRTFFRATGRLRLERISRRLTAAASCRGRWIKDIGVTDGAMWSLTSLYSMRHSSTFSLAGPHVQVQRSSSSEVN